MTIKALARLLRTASLAILSGGSCAIVFAAIVLVKAAQANGVPVAEAAAINAPVFLQFSKVALGASVILLIAELIGGLPNAKNKLHLISSGASALCIIATLIFAFGIVSPMEQLLPDIRTVTAAQEQFHKLHELSRAVFGSVILFAFVSLLLPCLGNPRPNGE